MPSLEEHAAPTAGHTHELSTLQLWLHLSPRAPHAVASWDGQLASLCGPHPHCRTRSLPPPQSTDLVTMRAQAESRSLASPSLYPASPGALSCCLTARPHPCSALLAQGTPSPDWRSTTASLPSCLTLSLQQPTDALIRQSNLGPCLFWASHLPMDPPRIKPKFLSLTWPADLSSPNWSIFGLTNIPSLSLPQGLCTRHTTFSYSILMLPLWQATLLPALKRHVITCLAPLVTCPHPHPTSHHWLNTPCVLILSTPRSQKMFLFTY